MTNFRVGASSGTMTFSTAAPSAGSVNWITAGKVTPVRDQQQCGEFLIIQGKKDRF